VPAWSLSRIEPCLVAALQSCCSQVRVPYHGIVPGRHTAVIACCKTNPAEPDPSTMALPTASVSFSASQLAALHQQNEDEQQTYKRNLAKQPTHRLRRLQSYSYSMLLGGIKKAGPSQLQRSAHIAMELQRRQAKLVTDADLDRILPGGSSWVLQRAAEFKPDHEWWTSPYTPDIDSCLHLSLLVCCCSLQIRSCTFIDRHFDFETLL
jgi:hypothetical protein